MISKVNGHFNVFTNTIVYYNIVKFILFYLVYCIITYEGIKNGHIIGVIGAYIFFLLLTYAFQEIINTVYNIFINASKSIKHNLYYHMEYFLIGLLTLSLSFGISVIPDNEVFILVMTLFFINIITDLLMKVVIVYKIKDLFKTNITNKYIIVAENNIPLSSLIKYLNSISIKYVLVVYSYFILCRLAATTYYDHNNLTFTFFIISVVFFVILAFLSKEIIHYNRITIHELVKTYNGLNRII